MVTKQAKKKPHLSPAAFMLLKAPLDHVSWLTMGKQCETVLPGSPDTHTSHVHNQETETKRNLKGSPHAACFKAISVPTIKAWWPQQTLSAWTTCQNNATVPWTLHTPPPTITVGAHVMKSQPSSQFTQYTRTLKALMVPAEQMGLMTAKPSLKHIRAATN